MKEVIFKNTRLASVLIAIISIVLIYHIAMCQSFAPETFKCVFDEQRCQKYKKDFYTFLENSETMDYIAVFPSSLVYYIQHHCNATKDDKERLIGTINSLKYIEYSEIEKICEQNNEIERSYKNYKDTLDCYDTYKSIANKYKIKIKCYCDENI